MVYHLHSLSHGLFLTPAYKRKWEVHGMHVISIIRWEVYNHSTIHVVVVYIILIFYTPDYIINGYPFILLLPFIQ